MISENLTYLLAFLQKPKVLLLSGLEQKLCPAEELGLEYSRAEKLGDRGEFDIIFGINPKILKEITPTEKVRLYEVLRIFSLEDSGTWKFLFDDYCHLLDGRGFWHERYFYLNSLTDSMFAYEMDDILTPGTARNRNFHRQFFSTIGREKLNLESFLLKYCRVTCVKRYRKRPIRLVRHKGYRDHGSLGTGAQLLAREVKKDVWLQEKEDRRKKKTQDFKEFLLGLGGWI